LVSRPALAPTGVEIILGHGLEITLPELRRDQRGAGGGLADFPGYPQAALDLLPALGLADPGVDGGEVPAICLGQRRGVERRDGLGRDLGQTFGSARSRRRRPIRRSRWGS